MPCSSSSSSTDLCNTPCVLAYRSASLPPHIPCAPLSAQVSNDDYGGLSERAHAADTPKGARDPADEVLMSEGLANKLVSIPGMDNYFVYQLEFKRVSKRAGSIGYRAV